MPIKHLTWGDMTGCLGEVDCPRVPPWTWSQVSPWMIQALSRQSRTIQFADQLFKGYLIWRAWSSTKELGSTDVVDVNWFHMKYENYPIYLRSQSVLIHGNHFRFALEMTVRHMQQHFFVVRAELHFTSLLPAGYEGFVLWVKSHGSWSLWK